jgi:hypothetical protein
MLRLGVEFGIKATMAVLSKPPPEALESVDALLSEVKADMRARIDGARR